MRRAVVGVWLAVSSVGLSLGMAAAPPVAAAPTVTVQDMGSEVFDVVADGSSLWVSLPVAGVVAELDETSLVEQRQISPGQGQPRGIDRLSDGVLAVANHGAQSYSEIDTGTGIAVPYPLPELEHTATWDVIEAPDGAVLVTADSGGQADLVRVDRSDGHAATKVGGDRRFGSKPRLAQGGDTVVVGQEDEVISFDATDPALPVLGVSSGRTSPYAAHLAVSPDGDTVFVGGGTVARSSDMISIGAAPVQGVPVALDGGARMLYVSDGAIEEVETTTYSIVTSHAIEACGFTAAPTSAVAVGARTVVVAAGTRVCRIVLPAATPPPAPEAVVPVRATDAFGTVTRVVDAGTSVGDVVVSGNSLWATLPGSNRLLELDAATLAERRRPLIGSGPRGIDVRSDGNLVVALDGATGFAEFTPATAAIATHTVPLLGAERTWDIAVAPDGSVLVSATDGLAYIVRVDPANGYAAARVADGRIIRAAPTFGVGPDFVVVGEDFLPNSLYKLDASNPAMPIVAEDRRDLSGTTHPRVSPDGSWIHLRHGDFVDPILVRRGTHGFGQLFLPSTDGEVLFAIDHDYVVLLDATSLSFTGFIGGYDISGCGFPPSSVDDLGLAVTVPDSPRSLVVTAGSRICRIDYAPGERPVASLHYGDGPVSAPFVYGGLGDTLLFCDWDGDGVDEAVAVRPSDNNWYLARDPGPGVAAVHFRYGGNPALGDIPICGDWNGDGHDTPGVYRTSTSEFHLRYTNRPGPANRVFRYGNPSLGDRPITGDFDGDGDDEPSIFRTSDNQWYIKYQAGPGRADTSFRYGRPGQGDTALVGDWIGDGVDTIAIVRDGLYYLRNSLSGGPADIVVDIGAFPADTPVAGRWAPTTFDGLGYLRTRFTG